MNHRMRLFAALAMGAALTWTAAPVSAQTAALKAGMDGLFSVAQTHNATLKSMKSALVEAQAGVETAKMDKLPNITGQVSVSYLGNARIWNRKFGESTKAEMPHFGNNFLLRAEQAVYTGGAVTGGIQLAQQTEQMAGLSVESERQRVNFLLVGLYLQLHSLRNQQAVYHTNSELAQAQIDVMKKRREQGVSLRNDVTRYELQLQQMLLGESTSVDNQSIVRKQLLTALGTDSAAIALLDESAFDEAAILPGVEAEWQQLAAQKHIGLQKSALSVDMSRTKEKLERAGRRPKVAIVAEDHLDGPITIEVPPIDRNLNYWYVGVGVSYDFSSLYKGKRKVRQAQLGTAFAEDEHTAALQGVSDAVHAAYASLGTARTELVTQKKSVQLAAENYDVVSKRYQNGLAIVTDLTDAANMKLEAELALVNARINLVYAYYNLKYAAGDL